MNEKKYVVVGIVGLLICVMLAVSIAPFSYGDYAIRISGIEPQIVSTSSTSGIAVTGVGISEIGVPKIAVSGIRTQNETETEILENLPTIEEAVISALNCSEEIVFIADDFYQYINKSSLDEFIEEYEAGDCVWEVHDCDDIAMEFSVNIRKEFAKQELVPAVGVVWTEDHATNFWISDDKNHTIWVFDMADKEKYSMEDQIVTFVYI